MTFSDDTEAAKSVLRFSLPFSDDIEAAKSVLRYVAEDHKKDEPILTNEAATHAYLESIAYSLLDIAKSLDSMDRRH